MDGCVLLYKSRQTKNVKQNVSKTLLAIWSQYFKGIRLRLIICNKVELYICLRLLPPLFVEKPNTCEISASWRHWNLKLVKCFLMLVQALTVTFSKQLQVFAKIGLTASLFGHAFFTMLNLYSSGWTVCFLAPSASVKLLSWMVFRRCFQLVCSLLGIFSVFVSEGHTIWRLHGIMKYF